MNKPVKYEVLRDDVWETLDCDADSAEVVKRYLPVRELYEAPVVSESELWALLPQTAAYLDPPDGGDVPLIEQLRRMAADAKRWRDHLRTAVPAAPPAPVAALAETYGLACRGSMALGSGCGRCEKCRLELERQPYTDEAGVTWRQPTAEVYATVRNENSRYASLFEWLTAVARASQSGATIQCTPPFGFRFMRHHYLGPYKPTLLEALTAARENAK